MTCVACLKCGKELGRGYGVVRIEIPCICGSHRVNVMTNTASDTGEVALVLIDETQLSRKE
jgi:hypothetical protein